MSSVDYYHYADQREGTRKDYDWAVHPTVLPTEVLRERPISLDEKLDKIITLLEELNNK